MDWSGYNCPNRSIKGRASGVLFMRGALTGWSHTRVVMFASNRSDRIVETQASSVSSVPLADRERVLSDSWAVRRCEGVPNSGQRSSVAVLAEH